MGSENDIDPEILKIRQKKIESMAGKNMSESTKNPVTLTDQSFDGFIQKQGLSIVDCWAEWCGPCKMLSPVIDQLAQEYSGKVAFGKLNVDENPSTSSKFGIMSIPTLLVFTKGKLIDNLVGAHPYQTLKTKIDEYLSKVN